MADGAVQLRLPRHPPEFDASGVGEVTALLDARRVRGKEAMRGSGMAGQALHLALECRGIRFQVSPMARCRRDGLPGFLGGPGDVAALAGGARDLGVRRDLFATDAGHPQDHLHRFLDRLELVAGVAAQGVMLAFQLRDRGSSTRCPVVPRPARSR